MDVSILHLSDLHRHPEDPIGNQVLLQSLIQDRERYSKQGIRSPDVIVVSGDIIQGSLAQPPEAERRIGNQYDEAAEFLELLSYHFLSGDRSRLVIVPGNHDVSDFRFRSSLAKLPSPTPQSRRLRDFFRPGTKLRWDWNDLSFYEIANDDAYLQRFLDFRSFFDSFYSGTRTFSLDPKHQVGVFDLPSLSLVIVGFNSCYNNDPLNRVADIHPDCIATGAAALRRPRVRPTLPIAVWHHNAEGYPYQNDYLHPGHLQCLLDAGFCLALHGHQHRPERLHRAFKFGALRPLPLVSAGTLCGPPDISHARSYNIVELSLHEARGRLHVRENASGTANPLWAPRSLQGQPNAVVDFDIPQLLPATPLDETQVLQAAANHIRDGAYDHALHDLASLPSSIPMVRRLRLECLAQQRDHLAIVQSYAAPESTTEAIHLLDALYQTKNTAGLAQALNEPFIASSSDPSIVELRTKYRRRVR